MSLIIRNGCLFNGISDQLQKNDGIYIANGKIVSIGTQDQAETTLDATGCYILPGLINAHVHLIWDAGPDPEVGIANKPDSFVSLIAAQEAQKHLSLGITTVRDTGSIRTTVLSLRDAIKLGITLGPNIVTSGPPIVMTGGHICRLSIEANGEDAIRAAARLNLHNKVDFIKLMATGGVYTEGEEPGSPQLSEEEMRAAVAEAHKRGKKVTVHAEGLEGIKNALRAGVDCVEHANYADDEAIEMMVQNGIYLVPTIICFIRMTGETAKKAGVPDWAIRKAEQVVAAQKISFRKAVEAGVKIVAGTDAGAPLNTPEDFFTELELMQEGGMSKLDILKACTSRAAEAVGLNSVGMLEVGRMADVLVVEGNFLEELSNLRKIRYVIKGGKVVVNNMK